MLNSTNEIIIEWDTPKNNNPIVVKPSKNIFWEILKIVFCFLTGYFFGVITVIFLYH
jgi:hypothetical protein